MFINMFLQWNLYKIRRSESHFVSYPRKYLIKNIVFINSQCHGHDDEMMNDEIDLDDDEKFIFP